MYFIDFVFNYLLKYVFLLRIVLIFIYFCFIIFVLILGKGVCAL